MATKTRQQLKALIVNEDEPRKLLTNVIESSLNKEDDIWVGTQAEYDALGTYDAGTFYYITE